MRGCKGSCRCGEVVKEDTGSQRGGGEECKRGGRRQNTAPAPQMAPKRGGLSPPLMLFNPQWEGGEGGRDQLPPRRRISDACSGAGKTPSAGGPAGPVPPSRDAACRGRSPEASGGGPGGGGETQKREAALDMGALVLQPGRKQHSQHRSGGARGMILPGTTPGGVPCSLPKTRQGVGGFDSGKACSTPLALERGPSFRPPRAPDASATPSK